MPGTIPLSAAAGRAAQQAPDPATMEWLLQAVSRMSGIPRNQLTVDPTGGLDAAPAGVPSPASAPDIPLTMAVPQQGIPLPPGQKPIPPQIAPRAADIMPLAAAVTADQAPQPVLAPRVQDVMSLARAAGIGADMPGYVRDASPAAVPAPSSTPQAAPAAPSSLPAAAGWLPQAVRAATAGTLPTSLDALANAVIMAESGGDPNAVNPRSGASGLMQIVRSTAESPGYGVRPMDWSRRFDPEENRRFGTDYLNAMLRIFNGDTELALMAYNWGPGNVQRWLRQGADPTKVPKQTRDYISRILPTLRQEVHAGAIEGGTGEDTLTGGGGDDQLDTFRAPPSPAPPEGSFQAIMRRATGLDPWGRGPLNAAYGQTPPGNLEAYAGAPAAGLDAGTPASMLARQQPERLSPSPMPPPSEATPASPANDDLAQINRQIADVDERLGRLKQATSGDPAAGKILGVVDVGAELMRERDRLVAQRDAIINGPQPRPSASLAEAARAQGERPVAPDASLAAQAREPLSQTQPRPVAPSRSLAAQAQEPTGQPQSQATPRTGGLEAYAAGPGAGLDAGTRSDIKKAAVAAATATSSTPEEAQQKSHLWENLMLFGLATLARANQGNIPALASGGLAVLEANREREAEERKEGRQAPTVQTFYDEQGQPYMAQWNPTKRAWERVGPGKPDTQAPTVQTFYDEQGQPYMAQWNPTKRAWERVGPGKPEKQEPYSDFGKLNADLNSGRITREQYTLEIERLLRKEQTDPQTTIGKARLDLETGRITPKEFQAIVEKETRADPMTLSIIADRQQRRQDAIDSAAASYMARRRENPMAAADPDFERKLLQEVEEFFPEASFIKRRKAASEQAPSADAAKPTASAEPPGQQTDPARLLAQASAAIANGAPRDQVIARLRQMGVPPAGL